MLRHCLIGAVAATSFWSAAASAAVTIDINESGPDVVATASGTLDIAGLSNVGTPTIDPFIWSTRAAIGFATSQGVQYSGLTGPGSFGTGAALTASSYNGNFLFLGNALSIVVQPQFSSGGPLTGQASWLGQTFASLGLTPGQYVWTLPNDAITVNVGSASAVPEPSTWTMLLLGFGALGFAMRRRKQTDVIIRRAA